MSRNPEVLRDSPPEQRNGVKGFLSRHKGKILLGLGLVGSAYGLGKMGTTGMLSADSMIGKNAPKIASFLRPVSAHASRFTHVADGLLQRAPFGARWANTFQTPTDGTGREFIRKQIIDGETPLHPSQIS